MNAFARPFRKLRRRIRHLLAGRDRGTVAVTFMLALPILLLVYGILVQYALLANAQITLDRALAAAARSAQTSLPTDATLDGGGQEANVRRAVLMVLESLSPQPNVSASDEAASVASALKQVGANPQQDFASRYTYADEATTVDIEPIDASGRLIGPINYARAAAARVRITISYNFRMTVPIVNNPVGQIGTVAGIQGRFRQLTAQADVQLSPGRETNSNATGDPQ